MTRLQATVALLQATLDYFPFPETWTGGIQRRGVPRKSDPKQLGHVSCDTCHGEGCKACWFKGTFVGDAYLAERGLIPFTLDSFARFVDCDACGGRGRLNACAAVEPSRDHPSCERCLGTGKVPGLAGGPIRFHEESNGQAPRQGDRVIDSLEDGHTKRDDLAIYREHLLPALATLKGTDRYAHLLVEWVWVLGAQTPRSLPAAGTVRLVRGTRLVESVLPDGFERRLPREIRGPVLPTTKRAA